MEKFFSNLIFTRSFLEHAISALGILCIAYIGKEFLIFLITTFLCASLFGNSSKFIHHFVQKHQHTFPDMLLSVIRFLTREEVLIVLLYVIFGLVCVFTISDIGPTLIADIAKLLQEFSQRFGLDINASGIQDTLGQWQNISTQINDFLTIISPAADTEKIVAQIIKIGGIFFQVIFAYLVSFIWLLEQHKVKHYLSKLKSGPFAFFYHDLKFLFHRITKSFGLVFFAQFKIALVNTVLTVGGLLIIGFFYGQMTLGGSTTFPYILALAFTTFLTSFVPILGVFISGIPITFAGVVEYPGWSIVIALLVMLFIIHVIEGYFLNPRIVGQSLNIPAPIIFIILLVSEHFMGIAGFFLGVPLYILLLEFIEGIGKFAESHVSKT